MPRSGNLDEIAPDDQVISETKEATPDTKPVEESSPSEKNTSDDQTKKEEVKPKQKPEPSPDASSADSKTYRQKIYEILGHTKSSLSSFLVRPDIFNFEERDEKEEILLVLRQHWFVNVTWIFVAFVMIIAPMFLNYVPLLSFFPPNYQFVAVIFWYLITTAFIFERFMYWYFNVYIITDERVIDIDFNNLLDKKYSEAKIAVIQDVTSRVAGVSQTLLNYGTVLIQTASEIPELVFEKVPNPEKVIKVLEQLRQEEEQEAIEGRIR